MSPPDEQRSANRDPLPGGDGAGPLGLEARWIGPPPQAAPTIVVLHEGLGSVSLWRDFPERVAALTVEPTASALLRRLARHHGANSEALIRGWTEVWLSPEFARWNIEEVLPTIAAPILAIQGREDEYSTLRQIEAIVEQAGGPVETLVLDGCGHAPHVDRPAEVLAAAVRFVRGLMG